MKTIFNILLILHSSLCPMLAQKDENAAPTGFIRVVNAVAAGTGPAFLLVDGEDMRTSGYKLGDATGGMGMKAGSHKVLIKREGVKEGSTTVVLDKDQTVTLIPFTEKVPATDQDPAHFEIRILRLKQRQVETARLATFVSVSANPEVKVELGSEDGKAATVFVKRLAIAETPLNYTQGYAPAKINGAPIKPIPIGGAGNYVVVLYDDTEGKVQSLYFRDFKFLSAD
ncbi:MAG: hypothetical protein H7Y36_09485 [Armatimonadetes bacterium]|nr:hypothetical protein [Akkermansiaceae bacterium]